jgi:hypothetical protein
MRGFASLGTGVIAFVLASVFYQACLLADASTPFEYQVLSAEGAKHICDQPGSERPQLLCALRAGLGAVGVVVSSGGGVAQLIAPLMFVVIGIRLLARAWWIGFSLVRNRELSET